MSEPVHVANCSGFLGDRLAAAREIVDAHREGRAHVDVLTGDWLAELTMGLLAKQRDRARGAAGGARRSSTHGTGDAAQRSSTHGTGYAATFVTQMADVLADCLVAGIQVVTNAGGLDPAGCAAAVEALGTGARVAVVDGDDVTDLVSGRDDLVHLDTGEPLTAEPVVANAYLGARGIVAALEAGADVVVTGRVTDAAVVVGPAAYRHGWGPGDLDALAGAVAAGHVIECGAQATGGNFSFASELGSTERVGFPIAEIAADGSAVITKAAGSGGAVTVETVTAQLLYEIDGPRYLTPDVVARFDTLALADVARDRVRITGASGEPPPETVKVGVIVPAGWHNEITLVLTGLDVEAKAEQALDALWAAVPGGRASFERVETRLLRADRDDPTRMTEAVSLLTIAVAGEERAVGRLSRAAVETALASYAGFFATTPPGPGSAASVFWPIALPAGEVRQRVFFEGVSWEVASPSPSTPVRDHTPVQDHTPVRDERLVRGDRSHERVVRHAEGPAGWAAEGATGGGARADAGRAGSERTRRIPLGRLVGARSGDKGGNATLGLWARDDHSHAWLADWWDDEHVAALLGPDAHGCPRQLWTLPNLRAVGVSVLGFLGRGVADNLALDPQAKGLGEFVRARHVEVPEELAQRTGER